MASVAPTHLDFASGLAKAFLYPHVRYVPKVTHVTPQPVILQAFSPSPYREPDQHTGTCNCVRALDAYVHRTAPWRRVDQLLVCYGPAKRDLPASKQTLSRWIVDAISISYESFQLPSPMGVRAHSTRSVTASKVFFTGVPIQDICNAEGWSTALTFFMMQILWPWHAGYSRLLRPLAASCAPLGYTLGRDTHWSRSQSVSGRSSSS